MIKSFFFFLYYGDYIHILTINIHKINLVPWPLTINTLPSHSLCMTNVLRLHFQAIIRILIITRLDILPLQQTINDETKYSQAEKNGYDHQSRENIVFCRTRAFASKQNSQTHHCQAFYKVCACCKIYIIYIYMAIERFFILQGSLFILQGFNLYREGIWCVFLPSIETDLITSL